MADQVPDWAAAPAASAVPDWAQPTGKQFSPLQSGVAGAAEGATFGLAPALEGVAAASGTPDPSTIAGRSSGAAALRPLQGAWNLLTGKSGASEAYSKGRESSLADFQAAQKQHPYAYGAGEVGGSLLPMAAMPFGEGVGLAGRIGQGAKIGATSGALGGVGQGVSEGSAEQAVKGGIAGAGIGAVTGAAAAPLAELAAFPFGRWRTNQTPGVAPVVEDLYDAGRDAYRQIQNMGFAMRPQPIGNLGYQIENQLAQRGFSQANVPETFDVVRKMQGLRNAPAGASVSASDFDTMRQTLLQATRNFQNLREGPAAWEAINTLDNYLSRIPSGHVLNGDAQTVSDLFNEARGNWAAAKRAEMVAGKLALGNLNAETAHSGMNIDNATRQAVKQLIRPKTNGRTLAQQHGFSDDEIGMMNDVARGSASTNTLRYVGNLLGGGGGLGQLALTGLGIAGDYETGRHEFLALPALGLAARYGAGVATQRQAQQLLDAVARRSPLGRSVPPVQAPSAAVPGMIGSAGVRLGAAGGESVLPSLQGSLPVAAQDQNQRQRGGRLDYKPNQNGGGQNQRFAHGGKVKLFHPQSIGARKAKDGRWYIRDKSRPGRYLMVVSHV